MTKNRTPQPPATSSHPLTIGIAVLVVAALAFLLVRGLNSTAPEPESAASPSASPTTPPPAAPVAQTPATSSVATAAAADPFQSVAASRQSTKVPAKGALPPLPNLGFAPPRPIDVVQAVFEFAARRPDVLEYVPCFCGCESSGHRGNDDCFVKHRDASGNVEWEPHGMS